MRESAKDIARGKWSGILASLGIPEEALTGKHCPCPMCGGTDRFRFTDHQSDGMYICNQCGSGDGFDLLMHCLGWDYRTAASEVESIAGNVRDTFKPAGPDPSVRLNAVRQGVIPATQSSDVCAYLESRGLEIPPGIKAHPGVAYYEDKRHVGDYPAMLGLVQKGRKALTYHVTYLQGGRKAPVETPRKILKPIENINGGAIRLYPAASHMGVAEGIESAIAARMLTGIPAWSVLSTSGMEAWYPPEGVERVTVFADADDKYGGQKAAYALAHKLAVKGFAVNVRVPEAGDFNDVLLRGAA